MRPSDENQDNRMHPHIRPNLMSSARRGGIEDSILAKLEREPARRGAGGNGFRLAWYGTAVAVAVVLTAVLAWLTAGAGPAPIEVALRAAPVSAVAELAPPEPVATAVIIDSPPEPPPASVAPAPPPLRLLEPVEARPAPAKVAAAPIKAAPARQAEPRAAAPARARVQATRPATRQAARPARPVNQVRPEPHDDSDVALISAVISHANAHAVPDNGEPSTAPCADDSCRTRAR